jgi:hypothetical protein
VSESRLECTIQSYITLAVNILYLADAAFVIVLKPAPGAGIRTSASVTCYPVLPRAMVQTLL